MAKSTATLATGKAAKERPPKPYPEFPMYAHPSGNWARKLKPRGALKPKVFYFGPWGRRAGGELIRLEDDGVDAALKKYKAEIDNIRAGRPRKAANHDGLTIKDLCNRFLNAKRRLRENGELAWSTWHTYKAVTDRLVRVFGDSRIVEDLTADEFGSLRADMAKKKGPVALGVEIQRTRTVFKFAFDEGLIDKPVRFGQQFNKPSKTTLRKARASNGQRMLEPKQLQLLLDAASPQVKAMLLLGLNAGLGNTDCANLSESHLDLDGGWLTYPREKTGVARRAKLWPETTTALRTVLANRKEPKDAANKGVVFLTKYRHRWVKTNVKGTPDDAIAKEVRKLLDETKLYRRGIGFYTMRHVFRTVADATRDFPAVRFVMGHVDSSMDDVYRERIEDDRLEAVADHVRKWLFPKKRKPRKSGKIRSAG
ncbi:MAG: tyrosine-type recombinase/integrase [Pirellulaceae bacterium]